MPLASFLEGAREGAGVVKEKSVPEGQIDPESLRTSSEQPSALKRVELHLRRRTIAGLLELLPLIVTVLVVVFLVGYADIIRSAPMIAGQPWDFPGVGLIIVVVVAYLVGALTMTALGRKAMEGYSWALYNIPIVHTIFGVTKQAITSFSGQFNFSRVVFVEWPRDGMMAMGFVTGRVSSANGEKSIVAVYIPTVPNPTSGNMAFVIEDDVMETNLSVDAAMKLVFSGGIVLPDSIAFARIPVEARDSNDFLGMYYADSKRESGEEASLPASASS